MYNKLERKFGKYAIKNLMKYIVMLYILGYVIYMIGYYRQVNIFEDYLSFYIPAILKGQVWRVVTWIIQPLDSTLLFMLISVYFYYWIGSTLERYWGSFRFNLFYFSGILCNVLAAVILYIITEPLFGVHVSYAITLEYVNLSMFLAFATLFSDVSVLLFFILPIKIKYLAYVYVGVEIYGILHYYIQGDWKVGLVLTVLCVVSMLNFLVFFLNAKKHGAGKFSSSFRSRRFERSYKSGQSEGYRTTRMGEDGRNVKAITRHKCAVCGRTELDDPELEFRFCSKCDGNYEYCMEHLYTHTHVIREIINPDKE